MAVGMSRQHSDDEVVLRAERLFHNGGDYAEVIRNLRITSWLPAKGNPPPPVHFNGEKCVFPSLQNQSISQSANQSISKSISWSTRKMISAPLYAEHALWMLCVL